MKCVINLVLILISTYGIHGWTDTRVRRFKDDFLFGVSTSAYQVEGAWNEDGKGQSIWDKHFHDHPEVITDGRNGDVASDSYHNYKRDVEMLRELGVNHYRFSISWTRVLPDGHPNKTNEKGLEYYDNLIDELTKYGIKPMITLYHFDLPQNLQDLGGWKNPLSVGWFLNYAKVVFERYAHKVPYWITINQPNSICAVGLYDAIQFTQGKDRSDVYSCIKNVMLAHAKVYRLYQKEYKNNYKGSVGISLGLNWADPVVNTTENAEATALYRMFTLDMYLHPIWSKTGDFPIDVKRRVKELSTELGYSHSTMLELSREEIKLLKGSSDFIGINHYTTMLVSKSEESCAHSRGLEHDLGIKLSYGEKWAKSQSSWLRGAAYGLYRICIYINLKYDYPPMFITEHGWSTDKGLKDTSRVENIRQYLKALLYALEDGANVKGYTLWSLMDNVEWFAGTSERFGLYEVDFDSEEKTRTARLSAIVYKRIIKKKIVEEDWQPKSLSITVSKKKKIVRDDL